MLDDRTAMMDSLKPNSLNLSFCRLLVKKKLLFPLLSLPRPSSSPSLLYHVHTR
jgi:hypothetical protein